MRKAKSPAFYIFILSLANFSIGACQSFFSASYSSLTSDLDFHSSFSISLFNALSPFMAIFGGPVFNFATKRFGRKFPTLTSTLTVIVGLIFITVTKKNFKWLAFCGIAIEGFGIGALSTLIPVYIAELAPNNLRGCYGNLNALFKAIGVVFVYFLGIWLKWRVIAGLSLIAPILDLFLLLLVPESPVVSSMIENKIKNKSIFHMEYLKHIILSFLIVFFAEFSGKSAVMANLNPIFIGSEITLESEVASTIVVCAALISILLATPLFDKIGRKIMWVISSFGQAICLLILWGNEEYLISKSIPILCLFLFIFFNGIGLNSLPVIVIPEIFSDEVRPYANGAAQALFWLLCSINVFSFQFMTNSLELEWTYFIYGMIMIFSGVFGIFLLPEMKGKLIHYNTQPDIPEKTSTDEKSILMSSL